MQKLKIQECLKTTAYEHTVYGATTLYNANIPEKLIQERTGHRSIKALRQYERTS